MIINERQRVDPLARTCSEPVSDIDSEQALCDAVCVRLGKHACRIICVDKVVPWHVESRHEAHPRQVYAEGEIAHFEFEHHRYALVSDETAPVIPKLNGARSPAPPDDLRDLLTNREMQIVQLICLGYLTKQVADRLHLSEFTVRSYLKTIYCKLGVRSRAAMVFRYAQAFSRDNAGA